ncbi:MAG: exodeoxyribonuclease V subunit gamma [Solirubrobacterales bacterium]|nr:exodeoxyribonuclease V subunit gamma [Solirubrobacterales bacterium]
MPLTLVLGPANSAKAGEVLSAYAAAAPRGALLVVPTAADADAYARELAERGSVLGSVHTFAGLAREIARRAGYSARPLSARQRERVLRRVLAGATLGTIGAAAATPGFAAAAGELIAELERSLITPARFAAALRAWAAEDPRRTGYAHDLGTIYGAYARALERIGRVDRDLFAWRALDALRDAPGRWGSEAVFFYGFDDLHPLQRDAVQTLAGVVGAEVTVSLTYEAGRAALAARAPTVEELRSFAARVLELPALEHYYEPGARAALHHLERSLFETGAARIDPGAAVRLLEAGGERAEAELIAAEVLGLLRAGVPAEEIAIVHRSPERVAPVIERQCARYGIATAGRPALAFAHTALGRAVLALARCALLGRRAPAQELLAYLRAPGVLREADVADALEAELRREGVRTAPAARERLELRLAEIDEVASAADPAAELVGQARRLLAAPDRGAAPVLDLDRERDARAVAALADAVAELAELGEALSVAEVLELLEQLHVPAGASPAAGAVLLTEPLAIRARRFRAVFVCGLQEGEFPAPAAPEPFLSDEHRRELAAASGLRLQFGDGALERERYLFYASLSRATETVVLSYRSSDEEGNLALPSPFLADVAEVLDEEWPQRRRIRRLADVVWAPEQAPTAQELARSRAAAAGRSPMEPARELRLSAEALAGVRHRDTVSAGALEAYADCPVKWLVERELQPPRFDPEPEPLARGSYVHQVLEQVLQRLGGALIPERLPRALALLDEVVAELPLTVAPGQAAGVRAAAQRTVEADLMRYLEHEAGDGNDWPPLALELHFGFADEEGSLPALELGGVPLRGVIDRVDVEPAGRRAIIRDYKTGSTRPEYQGARWRADHQLQVALYMLVVRERLGLQPVAGLYQPVGGNDLRARGVFVDGEIPEATLVANDAREAGQIAEELSAASATAIALAARLRAGELTPCPQTCSRDGCRYPAICRVT